MPKNTPAEVAAKWKSRTQSASPEYIKGIQGVTVNPAQKAIAAKDKMVANFQQAMADGRYEQGLADQTLQGWQQKSINKGATRIAAGVQEAEQRQVQFYSGFLPAQAQITAGTDQMPSTTLEDRIQRMVNQVRQTATLKGQF